MKAVISKDGTSIAYECHGDGPAVILVGGALSSRPAATPLAALLADRFSVYSYDRRGRGDSGDTAPYAPEREIEDLQALIRVAGGSAYVMGASSGAVLSLEAAAQGLAITKLALYEPPFIVDHTRPLPPPDYVPHLRQLLTAGQRGEAVAYFMVEAVGAPAEMVTQMQSTPMWPGMEALAHTLLYDGAIMGDGLAGKPLSGERWATASLPILVMDGGASPQWAQNSVQALVEVLPHAERRTLPGQTHAVDPAVLAPVLSEFFAG